MPFRLGVPELLIILVIIIAVFGAGKLANLGGALGKGIKEFRTAVKPEDGEAPKDEAAPEAAASKPTADKHDA
jgi:sec-independent protein translocase protein TatA